MWNAANKPFNEISISGVPNMSGTLTSWMQNLTFNVITKEIVNYEVVEIAMDVAFKGVWQPLSPEKLKMKPEAQRSWKWIQVHAHADLSLKNDDVIKYKSKQYRVMERLDYLEYGYFEYHLVEDFAGSGPSIIVPEIPEEPPPEDGGE